MTRERATPTESLFTQVEISPATCDTEPEEIALPGEHLRLLRDLVAGQDRQNELLEELVSVVGANQRQRSHELAKWKQKNPELARNCREAAEALGKVQAEFLESITREVAENADCLLEGEYYLNEFVDRFGPRLAHLNGVLHVLSQLSAGPAEHPDAKASERS
jgi:hypothetical protein